MQYNRGITHTHAINLFGIQAEPYTSRLLGASLIGIGARTYFRTNKIRSFRYALERKIIWSIVAIIGIIITLLEGGSKVGIIYIGLGR